MMPYDENENRFEAARKAFQWMERSKPSVSARGEVALPEERGDGTPDGVAYPPHEQKLRPGASGRRGTDSEKPRDMVQGARNLNPKKSRRFSQSAVSFSFSAAFSCK